MGVRTEVTASMKIPISIGWKCSNCGCVNKSLGNLLVSSSSTVSGTSEKKIKSAVNNQNNIINETWKDVALRMILNPKSEPQRFRSNVFITNAKCTQCKKKEKWAVKQYMLPWMGICIIGLIISLLIAIGLPKNPIGWLLSASFLGAIVFTIVEDSIYHNTFKELAELYTPIIVSQSYVLNEYARTKGISMLSESDVDRKLGTVVDEDKVETKNKDDGNGIRFCRFCGAHIESNEVLFCGSCGNKVNTVHYESSGVTEVSKEQYTNDINDKANNLIEKYEKNNLESKDSIGESLRELKKLQEEGLINQEDYDLKKKQILGL